MKDDFSMDGGARSSPRAAAGDGADTKTCPMCGETIKAVARKCRFCGEILTPSGRPAGPESGAWRDGKNLVMSKDYELPDVCIKSNEPADGRLKRTLYWHQPVLYVLALVSLLIYIIVALIVRKRADIQVGLSEAWFRRRRRWIAIGWLSAFLGIGLTVTGLSDPEHLGWLIAVGFFGGVIAILLSVTRANVVRAARITDDHVWLSGVHPDFLAELPAWPGLPAGT